MPHSAPVRAQVTVTIRFVLMPQLRASERLADVARMALPSLVYLSSPCTAAITTMASPMIANWTAVSTRPPALTVGPWLIVYDTLVPPTMACRPNSMMSVMPSDTITIVIGALPRRWNGA
jgi:hypothetical protein